jgi:hypothetical protein
MMDIDAAPALGWRAPARVRIFCMGWRARSVALLALLCSCHGSPRTDSKPPAIPRAGPAAPAAAPPAVREPSNAAAGSLTSQSPQSGTRPPPLLQQVLDRGITPLVPEFAALEETPPLPAEESKQEQAPPAIRAEGGRLYRGNEKKPTVLFSVPGATPAFTALVGADFVAMSCPHEKVMPVPAPTPGKDSIRLVYPEATWATFGASRAALLSLGLYLSFDGPAGDLEPLWRLFPDVIAPADSLPISPLHPFGRRLYREYVKAYLRPVAPASIFFVQPAEFAVPLLNDLETRKAFRRAMEAKYVTIEEANRRWGTSFEGFWSVVPPTDRRSHQVAELGADSPAHGVAAGKAHILADWADYLWTNRLEVAGALTGLVRETTARSRPVVCLGASDALSLEPALAVTDAGVFRESLSFLREPGSIINLETTYLEELASGSGRPLVDFGVSSWPRETPAWQKLAFLRHLLWRRAWHGASAIALPLEAGAALAAAPRYVAEIRALAPLMRGDRNILFLHPGETLRTVPDGIRRRAVAYLVAWWKSLATQGFHVKVVATENLRLENLLRVRAVFAPLCLVMSESCFSLLEGFVQQGGIVVADWSAFAYHDSAGRRRHTGRLLGFQVVEPLEVPSTVRLSTGQEIELALRPVDETRGASVELLGAEPFGPRAGRLPVAAVNRYGQGTIYSVLLSLPERSVRGLIGQILWTNGIVPAVRVLETSGQEAELVETGLESGDETALLCLFNLGPARTLVVSFAPASAGPFRLRNTLTGACIPHPRGEQTWDQESLRQGVPVYLTPGEVATILLEDVRNGQTFPLPGIGPTRREILVRLAREKQRIGPLCLIPEERGTPFPSPLAEAILERIGFRAERFRDGQQLKEASWVWINDETRGATAQEVMDFVSRGGGLLIDAIPPPGSEPSGLVEDLLAMLGIRVRDEVEAASLPGLPRKSAPIVARGITPHPATKGVEALSLPAARALEFPPEQRQVLVYGLNDLVPVGAPLVVEGARGTGRVIVVGGCRWATPCYGESGSNARFLAACAQHLAGREPPVLDDEDLRACLFFTRARLLDAAQEERDAPRTTFEPYPIAGLLDSFPPAAPAEGSRWATFSPEAAARETGPER